MEKDLKEIEKRVLEFCNTYNCSLEINTLVQGRTLDGDILITKVCSKILT